MAAPPFPVTGQAQGLCDDQLWRTPGAGAFHRGLNNFKTGIQVSAINSVSFVTVTFCAIDQMRAAELAIVRRGISEMIVGRDDHQRYLFDGRDVQTFVRRAGLHPAFSDCC